MTLRPVALQLHHASFGWLWLSRWTSFIITSRETATFPFSSERAGPITASSVPSRRAPASFLSKRTVTAQRSTRLVRPLGSRHRRPATPFSGLARTISPVRRRQAPHNNFVRCKLYERACEAATLRRQKTCGPLAVAADCTLEHVNRSRRLMF